MLKKLKSWINRENKPGTPLWKALLLECRLPWRYKEFGLLRGLIYSFYQYNVNTISYWNRKFSVINNWRYKVYSQLMKYLPKNTKFSLLDIGCALGDGCIFMKKNFPKAEISGCDFSDVVLKKQKRKVMKLIFLFLMY